MSSENDESKKSHQENSEKNLLPTLDPPFEDTPIIPIKARKKNEVRIVVVDDNELARKTVVEILTEHKFNVVGSVGSAAQAIDLASQANPNLFIIDVIMPQVSGIELAKTITEKKINMGIIMMSSLNTEHIVVESISSGAIDFLQKPFSEAELIHSVERIAELIELDTL